MLCPPPLPLAPASPQLDADLALHGDFLEQYQGYLTQLVGYFLVEDAVQQQAAGAAGEPLDIVAQVRYAGLWGAQGGGGGGMC